MKLKKFVIFLFVILSTLIFAVGCNTELSYDKTGMAKVTFHLEGGVYRNCEGTVNYYYELAPGATRRIRNPAADKKTNTVDGRFANGAVTRVGYTLGGWFRTKTVSGESVAYSDEWDFQNDTITNDGVELYAKWNPNIKYSYSICCLDENGKPELDGDGNYIVIGEYTVAAGEKFNNDLLGYKDNRPGYTAVQGADGGWFYNADGTPWDPDTVHPGGEKSTDVPVFVHFMAGKFRIVSTKSELLSYIESAPWSNIFDPVGIRLQSDIDLGGEAIDGFRKFSGVFDGQNHTISNFKLSYGTGRNDLVSDFDLDSEGSQLHISLFDSLTNATVKDVTFENFTIDVTVPFANTKMVFVSPLCTKASGSTVSNVTLTGTVREVSFFENFDRENYYNIALDEHNRFLPITKVSGDKNIKNSTFTDVDLLGMAYVPLAS